MINNNNNKNKFIGSSETTRGTSYPPRRGKFLYWLTGFTEGDGTFFIRSNNTIGFEISQSTQDAQILYYIKKELGFGKVYHNSKTNVSRFVIPSSTLIGEQLIPLLDGLLQLKKRQSQFSALVNKYNELTSLAQREGRADIYIMSTTKLLQVSWTNSWLSGFIDAEGCFRINYDKTNNRYQLIFQITQDEKEILDSIKFLFSNTHKGTIRQDRGTYVFALSSKSSRKLLNDYLKLHPLKTKKRISWLKWLKAERILAKQDFSNTQKGKVGSKDWDKLERLRKDINKFNKKKV